MAELVRIETGEQPGVATLRLDRPKLNAFNQQLSDELDEVAGEIASSDEIRAVVVWGGPRVFAAGADINRFNDLSAADAQRFSTDINKAMLAIENLPQITISAVNGYALGGSEPASRLVASAWAADAGSSRSSFPRTKLPWLRRVPGRHDRSRAKPRRCHCPRASPWILASSIGMQKAYRLAASLY